MDEIEPIPLPELTPGDPRNHLSDDARKRVDSAHRKVEAIRLEAEVEIENKALNKYEAPAQSIRSRASLKAARHIMKVLNEEYSRLDISRLDFIRYMHHEIGAATNSLELSGTQQRLIEVEFILPPEATPVPTVSQRETEERPRDHPLIRDMYMRADAESRARAQLHYEKTLAELRKQQGLPDEPGPQVPSGESAPTTQLTTGEQIDRLRDECGAMSIEELADKADIHATNVSRHIRDESTPSRKNLRKYEHIFSKILKRNIVISKTQPKRR
jgi:hypothetical protein